MEPREFERELEKRFQQHLMNLRDVKLEARPLTAFCYSTVQHGGWRKYWAPITRHLRNLFFELQHAGPGPFFDREGHELTFEFTKHGTLYVWRHPKNG